MASARSCCRQIYSRGKLPGFWWLLTWRCASVQLAPAPAKRPSTADVADVRSLARWFAAAASFNSLRRVRDSVTSACCYIRSSRASPFPDDPRHIPSNDRSSQHFAIKLPRKRHECVDDRLCAGGRRQPKRKPFRRRRVYRGAVLQPTAAANRPSNTLAALRPAPAARRWWHGAGSARSARDARAAREQLPSFCGSGS